MQRTNFERLRVYQKAEELADGIWRIVAEWDGFAQDTVGQQFVRAADSIPAHIAKGSGRSTSRYKQHYLRLARGSLYETKNWLRRAYKRDLLPKQQVEETKQIMDALAPMLNAYLRAVSSSRSGAPRIKAPKGEA